MTASDQKLRRRTAEILLKDIGKVEDIEVNPPNRDNVSNTDLAELIPETLKGFLNHICSNRSGKDKNVLSVAHDIIVLKQTEQKKCLN